MYMVFRSPTRLYYHLMCSIQSNVNGFVYIVSFRETGLPAAQAVHALESSMSPDARQRPPKEFRKSFNCECS